MVVVQVVLVARKHRLGGLMVEKFNVHVCKMKIYSRDWWCKRDRRKDKLKIFPNGFERGGDFLCMSQLTQRVEITRPTFRILSSLPTVLRESLR